MVIYGTVTLLPLFLQDHLGYTAYNSGLAVSPGGIGALFSLLIAGQLVGTIDSRVLIGEGQRHQDVLAPHMTPYDLPFRDLLGQLK